jgi:hypothetical protein
VKSVDTLSVMTCTNKGCIEYDEYNENDSLHLRL